MNTEPPLTLYTVQGAHHAAPAVAVSVQIETVLARHAAELAPDKGVIPARITAPDGRAWIVTPNGTLNPETAPPPTRPDQRAPEPTHAPPAGSPAAADDAFEENRGMLVLTVLLPVVGLVMFFVRGAQRRWEHAYHYLVLSVGSTLVILVLVMATIWAQ